MATCCIQVPIREMPCPKKNSRKLRCLKALSTVHSFSICTGFWPSGFGIHMSCGVRPHCSDHLKAILQPAQVAVDVVRAEGELDARLLGLLDEGRLGQAKPVADLDGHAVAGRRVDHLGPAAPAVHSSSYSAASTSGR